MKLILIVAVGKNNEIGKDNNLIWHIKEDLQFFKNMTINQKILMGKNTFLSFPKPLKDRKHIVISTSLELEDKSIEVFRSIDEFLSVYKDSEEEIYVIGGASIYKAFLPLCEELYITEIDNSFDADTYFPEFDKSEYGKKELSSFEEPYKYKHMLYKKR